MTMFPALESPTARTAVAVGDDALGYDSLATAAGAVMAQLDDEGPVAVWAEPRLETCVGVVAAIQAGVPFVPLNPKIGQKELEHIVGDSRPSAVLAAAGAALPEPLRDLEHKVVDLSATGAFDRPGPPDQRTAMILYTSGTTGMPKGVVLSRRAVAFDIDALAATWEWTRDDVLVHGLPLFHVHGLVLGVVGPLRIGGTLRYLGRFDARKLAAAASTGGTMTFGVPTMYSRVADMLEEEPAQAASFRGLRLMVSGSAPLPAPVFERIFKATGQEIAERYGLTETIINCAVPATGERKPGYVGPPLPGTSLKIVDDDGGEITARDDETFGEVWVKGPNLFDGYLDRPDATAAAMSEGWFKTGDLAAVAPNGYVRLVGRRSGDLIKTGGYRVGAGEVENALLDHPGVAEAAVVGEPDDDLGERIVAFVVLRDSCDTQDLVDHVTELVGAHKRPRRIEVVEALPRNDMGKVQKSQLKATFAG